jgi:hypothetical protein
MNEGKKKVKSCPPVRAMLANKPLHRIAARLRFRMNMESLSLGGKR